MSRGGIREDSLGCHVATAASLGNKGKSSLPHRLNSLILLQGAVICTAFERNGAYFSLSDDLKPIAGCVVATTSCNDLALENMEMWHGLVLGRGGFGHIGQSCELLELKKGKDQDLRFVKGKFYNVNADAVINKCSRFCNFDVDGAHSDLFDPEVACMIWHAASVDVTDDDLHWRT